VSALSIAGAGTAAVAMAGNGMMGGHPMMGDQGMGGGMQGNMTGGSHGSGMGHGHCGCCGSDDTGGQTQNTQLSGP